MPGLLEPVHADVHAGRDPVPGRWSAYGRGYGFDPFTEDTQPYQSNHAWNAVLVDGGWYLVDTTWDAGGLEGQGTTFKWQYSTGFLFTPPDVFLCTHYPDDPRWQLLDQPLDLAHFRAQPVLWGDFGTLGLERKGDLQRVSKVADEGAVSFRVPPDVQLSGFLQGRVFRLRPRCHSWPRSGTAIPSA